MEREFVVIGAEYSGSRSQWILLAENGISGGDGRLSRRWKILCISPKSITLTT